MQLFTYFDDYTPSPHHGHEYGDISINADYKGTNYNLQGIMKSKGTLTEANKLGREILQQGIYSLRDTRVGITAIITPDIIPEGLRQTLNEQARFFNAKIMFLEEDFMSRLYLSYIKRLDEIQE